MKTVSCRLGGRKFSLIRRLDYWDWQRNERTNCRNQIFFERRLTQHIVTPGQKNRRLSNFSQINHIILLKEFYVTLYETMKPGIAILEKLLWVHTMWYKIERCVELLNLQVRYSNNNISQFSIKKTCWWKHFVKSIECKSVTELRFSLLHFILYVTCILLNWTFYFQINFL